MLHTMSFLKRFLFIIAVVVLVVPQFGFAQSEVEDSLSCFAFLTPQSVEVNIQADLPETLAGAEMSFSGTVFNASEYQLDNSTIYVRVFAYDGSVAETDHTVVDQFVIENGVSLVPQETKEVTYTWAVPASFESGAYYIVHYVSVNDRYDVSGILFSDNAISKLTTFKVLGQEGVRAPIKINVNDTSINGQSYDINQNVELDFSEPQVITTSISNPTDEILFLPLQWKQYVYNALSDENQINVDTEIVTIPANETVEVSYELVPQREGWGQVVASLQDGQAKHIVTVRYAQTGVQDGHVRFAGVTKHSDTEYTLQACALGTNLSSDGTFSTTVFDIAGQELFSHTQNARDGFTGMLEDFTVPSGAEIGDIVSTFSREGVVVHELTIPAADQVDESSKNVGDETAGENDAMSLSASQLIMLTVGCIVLLLIIFILFVLFRKKGETNVSTVKKDDNNNANLVPVIIALAVFGLSSAATVEAAPPTVNFSASPTSITAGNSSTLSWTTSGADSCTLEGSTVSTNGSQVVSPTTDTTYDMTCSVSSPAACGGSTDQATCDATPGCSYLNLECGFPSMSALCGTCLSFQVTESTNRSVTVSVTTPPSNAAPNAPTISGPTSGTVNGSNSFSFSATDSNGDRVRYEIDWDNNGTGDAWAGGTGYVNSGVAKSSSYTWSTTGSKTFRARTQDENGAFSGWSSHTITISNPPASGTITGSGCTIASGNSSCTGSVSWNTTGTSCRYVFNHGTGVLVSTNTSGTNQPTTLNFGTNRVALITDCLSAPINYYTAASIDDAYLTASCASGTTWNGSICAPVPPPPPVGTLSATGCTISVGSSVCNGTASWNVSGSPQAAVFNNTHGILYSTNLTGSNVPISLRHGSNEIAVFPRSGGFTDTSNKIDFEKVTASCASGSSWNGSSCAATPPPPPTTCAPLGSFYQWSPGAGGSWIPNGNNSSWNWNPTTVGMGWTQGPPAYVDLRLDDMGFNVTREWMYNYGILRCGFATLPPPPPPPTGAFSASPTTITAGEQVIFSWDCPAQLLGSPVTWFELNSLDSGTHYERTGDSPDSYTHTFTSPGTYTVDGECIAGNASVTPPSGVIETFLLDTVVITVNPAPSCVANWDCYDETIIEGPYTGDVYTSCQAAGSPPPANGGCVAIGSYMTTNSYDGTYSSIPPGASQCGSVPACTATPGPSVDLKVNGSDAPIIVSAGDDLRITWTSANVTSCVGAGNGWSTTALSGDTGSPSSVQASGLGVQTYTLSCNGYIDQVQVTVTAPANSAPNAPAITGPTSVETGAVNTFGISATDPDGDQLYYQIDWNNDGAPDVNSPNTGYWSSGTNISANRSWTSVGTYTFRARAIDSNGLQSAWSTHTVTVALPPVPPPNPTIEASVGGSAFTTSPGPLTPGQSLAIRWNDGSSGTAPGATCAGTNFNTSSNPTGTDTNSGSGGVTDPTPGSSLTYTVSCTNDSGSTVNRSVTVTSLDLPDLTIAIQPETLSSTFDPATGNYDSVSIPIFVENVSGTDVLNTFTVTIELDYDGGGVPEAVRTYNIAGLTGSGPGAANTQVVTFNSVPFGLNTVVTAVVDSANDVAESNEGNNEDTRNVAQVPPDIDMDLTIDPADLVRGGEDAVLEWDTNAAFPMTCTLSGPALATITFDPSVDGPTGTAVAGPITAKSVYTLTCIEPNTSTTYTASVSVETTGSVEEI